MTDMATSMTACTAKSIKLCVDQGQECCGCMVLNFFSAPEYVVASGLMGMDNKFWAACTKAIFQSQELCWE